jgi:hypothetical protein
MDLSVLLIVLLFIVIITNIGYIVSLCYCYDCDYVYIHRIVS